MEEIDDIKLEREHKLKIMLISLVVFLMSVIGVTYAYFSFNAIGNEEASSVEMTTAGMQITFTDGQEIVVEGLFSGGSVVKTFTIENTGTAQALYDIKISDVYGSFINDELVYTLSGTNGGANVSQSIMPTNDGLLKAKVAINAGVTQTYTLTVTFKETGSNQNYNQTATYRGKIQIISPYEYVEGQTTNIKLVDRIFLDNTAYPTNTSSKYVTGVSGINYANPSDWGYDGYYIDEEPVNFTSSSNKTLGTTFTYDATSGLFSLSGTTSSSKTYSINDIGKYTCNNNSAKCEFKPFELYKIVEVNGSTVIRVERYTPKPNRSYVNGLGLYYTNTNTVGNQTTYFFRGHVTNNYVSFAGDLWRIVRINEDGSIRLIRELNYTNAAFNTSQTGPKYVGYMFGTDEEPYANSNNSNIKTQVEAYYDSKLASLSSYLASIEFCNDRTFDGVEYYATFTRLYTNNSPVFTCPNESRDLFTLTTSSRGNKKLTKSIGLLTLDEVTYAGGVYYNSYLKLSKFYLSGSEQWFTASPLVFTNSKATMGVMFSYYAAHDGVANSHGVRPVISLKSDVLISGGTGSVNDPYVIVTN